MILIAPVALLGGCVSYHSAPIDPSILPAALTQRVLPARADWSEADLLAEAVRSSPALQAKASAYRSAVAAARVARVPLPAALQLTAEYSHQDNPAKPWLGSGSLDLPLDLGGRRDARLREADLAVAVARLDYLDALWATRTAIHRAVVDRMAADVALPLAVEAHDLRQLRQTMLQRRVAAGEDPQSTVLLANADLTASERRLNDVKASRQDAVLRLAGAIGVAPSQTDSLVLRSPTAAVSQSENLPRLRDEAALGRSDVLRAIIDYDRAENALRLEIANQYPAIRLQPGYTYERGIVKLPLGLNLQLPPIDGNRTAIKAAQERREEAARKLDAAQAALLTEIDRAAAAQAAALATETVRRNRDLPDARKLAASSARALAAGEIDRVENEAARAALDDAQLDRLDASRAVAATLVDLQQALRWPDDQAEADVMAMAMTRLGDYK